MSIRKGFWRSFEEKERHDHRPDRVWNLTCAIPALNNTLLHLGLQITETGSIWHKKLCAAIIAKTIYVLRCKMDVISVDLDLTYPLSNQEIRADPFAINISLN